MTIKIIGLVFRGDGGTIRWALVLATARIYRLTSSGSQAIITCGNKSFLLHDVNRYSY
jgi:hypothetical protein